MPSVSSACYNRNTVGEAGCPRSPSEVTILHWTRALFFCAILAPGLLANGLEPGSQVDEAEQEEFLQDVIRMHRGPGTRLTQTSVFDGEYEIPVVRVVLGDPGTGWPETFLFHAPSQPSPRPLLVAFHSFARSESEIRAAL